MTPQISVITPAYNAAAYVPKLANSVLNQTFRALEWIVVDDCSSDNTIALLEPLLVDPRMRLVRLPANTGVANARNAGIDLAQGEYLCFLDADDYWNTQKLALQYKFMVENACAISYMDYSRFNNQSILNTVHPANRVTYDSMLRSNQIANLTAMVRRDAIGNVRFERVGHEDYLFWLRLLRNTNEARRVPTPSVQCFYLVSGNSLSGNKSRAALWQWRIYRKSLSLSLVAATRYFAAYMVYAILKRLWKFQTGAVNN